MTAQEFAARVRNREQILGYWSVIDSPVSTEWLAHVGWDYIALDLQHGLIGYSGMLAGITAIDAAQGPAALVRVEANNATVIGRALDAGAAGVIVPLIDTAEDAAAAVAAATYPPEGIRSYGPMRSQLRIGPNPADANRDTVVLAMIETPQGLANVEEICAVPGLDGVYVGPSDLRLAVGGSSPSDPSVDEEFDAAIVRVQKAAAAAGITAGIHTASGSIAAQRLAQGYTLATVASDLTHLKAVSAEHLAAARG
ncbi:aldolase [Rhodococcus fascians]|uniref:HpcH/HpaI aldolase family protein n=1 Tax=Nocardiaceae TaxID=85025 RepID=UPI00050C4856|nr:MULTISPECIES: aldolase/citrate lyase family protein [Rhodococcus]OZD35968.1 aldolase [Rhodococcus sp. 06-1477-1B]KQU32268.1 aldolase [Rhodococcus sp. Leaf233]MBX5332655.1 aldolase [Rhodococcus fascians]MBY3985472.1 aldolase [Rhodococcus fascians]MBY3995384.1 aldolase [Rhodococcus fascians]